jgi:ATP-binding cassette, subfamily B, bacterial MsbA
LQVLNRFAVLLKPYWRGLVLVITLLLVGIVLELIPPLIQREIIDEVITTRDVSRLGLLLVILVIIYIIQQLTRIGDNYYRHVLGGKFILDLRVKLYTFLQKLSLSFYEKTSTGEIMSRVTNDVNAMEHFVTHGSAFIAVDLLRLVGTVFILLWLDWWLALLVFIPIPILAISLRSFNTRVRPIYRRIRDRLGDINSRLQDSLSGMKVIQAFAQEQRELDRFSTESTNYFKAQVQGIRYWSIFFPTMDLLSLMSSVIVLGIGATMVIRGSLTLGSLVAFVSYLQFLYAPLRRLVDIDNIFQEAIAAGERILELLDQPTEMKEAPDAIVLPALKGEVQFDQVTFAYQTGEEVLHDVTFHMFPGETVALVGPSGAGKTSIANLICRFYDPQQGAVRVDGYDLRQVTLDSLRSQIAVVLQDTFLFNTTVRENLTYGNSAASEENIIQAAKAAYAHDFIMDLPAGYDTEIGERGVRLSGGQKAKAGSCTSHPDRPGDPHP